MLITNEIFRNTNEIYPRTIELTTRTNAEYLSELDAQGMQIRDWTRDNMLLALIPLEKSEVVNLVVCSVADLGLQDSVTLKQIYAKADELGLRLCDPHVGPEMRLAFKDQLVDSYYNIAMEPIIKSDGRAVVWDVAHDSGKLWLDRRGGDENGLWNSNQVFVFSSRK